MKLIDKYFADYVTPQCGMKKMKIYVADGSKYALLTSEVKAAKDVRREYVRLDDWVKIAFENYAERKAAYPMFVFSLDLVVYFSRDPRNNGNVGKQHYALTTWKEELSIKRQIDGGRIIGMERQEVDINKWLSYVLMSYFEEEVNSTNPSDEEAYAINLEEMQEYWDNLTDDEKLS